MKIEKLTEDKIRIIMDASDIKLKNLDIKDILSKAIERQGFFLDILEKARNEVGFDADGCKLLIEAFSNSEDIFVFTITKYSSDIKNKTFTPNTQLRVKRKSLNHSNKQALYRLNSFDEFCDFCECLAKSYKFNIKNLSKNTYLYLYNDTYYFFMKNIISDEFAIKSFYSIASEFLTPLHYSNSFESKLLEYGKVIIKGNAIMTAFKYFTK